MRLKAILVLDLGTTNIKAIVYNEEGSVQAESSAPTPVIYKDNCMEINPSELWDIVKQVCKNTLLKLERNSIISAISLSSMAATLIPVNETGSPLYNAIGWADGRPLEKMNCFLDKFNSGYRIKGCGQYPLPMYAAFKIPWFNDKLGSISDRIYKWVNISDYIYSRFLGINEYYTDYSIASRTMLFDDVNKKWNAEALKEFNIKPDLLPVPLESGSKIGEIGEEGCLIGFNKDTQIVLGGHDHMCACLGAGITKPGVLLNSTGTSEAIITMLSKPYDIEKLPPFWMNSESSVIKDEIMAVAYTSASGQIFNSIQKTFLNNDSKKVDLLFNSITEPLTEPVYIPSLRASLPAITGSYIYMPTNFNSDMLAKAALIGIYYESKRIYEKMSAVQQQLKDNIVRIVGGQTKNDNALQVKCDIMGCVIERPKELNISAKGAFILAAVGCGIFNSIKEAADILYSGIEKDIFHPDNERYALYNQVYQERYLTYFKDGIFSL